MFTVPISPEYVPITQYTQRPSKHTDIASSYKCPEQLSRNRRILPKPHARLLACIKAYVGRTALSFKITAYGAVYSLRNTEASAVLQGSAVSTKNSALYFNTDGTYYQKLLI